MLFRAKNTFVIGEGFQIEKGQLIKLEFNGAEPIKIMVTRERKSRGEFGYCYNASIKELEVLSGNLVEAIL